MTTSPTHSKVMTQGMNRDQPRILVADSFQAEGLDALEALGCNVSFDPGCTKEDLPARLSELEPDILVVRLGSRPQTLAEANFESTLSEL